MKITAACLFAVLAIGASPIAQAAASVSSPQEDEKKKLDEWPAPADKDQLATDVQRIRKANTEEMAKQGVDGLIAEGAAAAPMLLKAFAKEKGEDALERIEHVLDTVTAAEHTRLFAKEFGNKSARVRIWALRRAALFPDSELAKDVTQRLDKLRKKKDKADPHELYALALCVTSTGEIVGLDILFGIAVKKWGDHATELRTALEPVRGPLASEVIGQHLKDGKRKEKVASLRMLAGCGDKETAVPLIAPLLDDNDNSIRVAAINALRGIIDNEPPLDKLPVFEAIEKAREWKKRV